MGYGSYTASDWTKLKTSKKLTNDQTVTEVFVRKTCNPKFDPKFIGTRECFDSEDHPHSTPIVVGLDVTGSMGYLAVKVATEALNDLIMKLYSTSAVEDPALMCAAYGDYRDASPLQVTQFESDIRIAEQLLELYFEDRGSGQVALPCLWSFLSRHTKLDAYDKRGEKGFLFTIGDDAAIRENEVPQTIDRVVGDDIPGATLLSTLNEVSRKFHVFHIMIGSGTRNSMLNGRKISISKDSVDLIPEIILGAIQMQNGKSLDEVTDGCDAIVRPALRNALSQLKIIRDNGPITL